MYYIGAHINREKTLLDTMQSITKLGGNALQIFVSNPRSAKLVNIDNYLKIHEEIHDYCKEQNFKLIVHSPYTINLAKELRCGKRVIDIDNCYWIQLLLHELHISDLLGSVGVVVHVGKHTTSSYEDGLENMRLSIRHILNEMAEQKMNTKLILETPAGQGTELLKNLHEFQEFFNGFSKEERKYLGICLDTAHVWSLGYELDEALKIFDKNKKDIIAIHYNNSKKGKGAMVDQHDFIFDGQIPHKSMENFLKLIKASTASPMIILETPSIDIKKELKWISNVLE
jgi:deoxyribonuclease-4